MHHGWGRLRRRGKLTAAAAITGVVALGLGANAAHSILATCTLSPTGGGVVYADKCFSGNLGTAIQDAIHALNGAPGIVDARGIGSGFDIDQPIVLGQQWQSIQLLLPPRLINVHATILVGQDSSIVGAPVGPQVVNAGVSFTATTLLAAPGANLGAVIQIGNGTDGPLSGDRAVLQDLIVDGNWRGAGVASGTAGGGASILALGANMVTMTRVSALRSAGDGIRLKASATPWRGAGGARISTVTTDGNAASGLHLVGTTSPNETNDVMVSQSWFENSGWAGINLENASALRVNNSDFGGNQYGITSFGTSWAEDITNNQFGGQELNDIYLSGTGVSANRGFNLIHGNSFIGGPTNDNIYIANSSHNSVTGNTITISGAGGVRFAGTYKHSLVSGNVFMGGASGKYINGSGFTDTGNVKS